MMDTNRIDPENVSVVCCQCQNPVTIPMTIEQEKRWRDGAPIQNILPEFVPREILISGYCDSCFDALFSDETEMV